MSWQLSALQPQMSLACCPDNTLQALQVVSFCDLQEQGLTDKRCRRVDTAGRLSTA